MTKVDKTKKQPLPSEFKKGMAATAVLFAGMMTGVYFLARNDNKPVPQPVAPAQAPYRSQGAPYAPQPSQPYDKNTPGIGFEINLEGPEHNPEWAGGKLTLDRIATEHFAKFAPVELVIPEIKYRAPLPVEDGMSSATLSFSKREKLDQPRYNILIIGTNPQTYQRVELFRHVIDPKEFLKK